MEAALAYWIAERQRSQRLRLANRKLPTGAPTNRKLPSGVLLKLAGKLPPRALSSLAGKPVVVLVEPAENPIVGLVLNFLGNLPWC